jgi:hypothetical protein
MNIKRQARKASSNYYNAAYGKIPRKEKKIIKKAVQVLIYDLKKCGVWDKTAYLYPFGGSVNAIDCE